MSSISGGPSGPGTAAQNGLVPSRGSAQAQGACMSRWSATLTNAVKASRRAPPARHRCRSARYARRCAAPARRRRVLAPGPSRGAPRRRPCAGRSRVGRRTPAARRHPARCAASGSAPAARPAAGGHRSAACRRRGCRGRRGWRARDDRRPPRPPPLAAHAATIRRRELGESSAKACGPVNVRHRGRLLRLAWRRPGRQGRSVSSPASRAGISGAARRIRFATSAVVSIASTASASRAERSAPSTASVRPANFARSSASVRKLSGSPFGTTTFCAKLWPRAATVSLPDMLAGNSASISGSNSQVTFGSSARTVGVVQQPVAVPAHRAGRERGGDDERAAELAVHHVLRIGLLLRRLADQHHAGARQAEGDRRDLRRLDVVGGAQRQRRVDAGMAVAAGRIRLHRRCASARTRCRGPARRAPGSGSGA